MIPFYWWAAQRTLLSEGIWKPKDLAFPVVMFCIISPLCSLSNIVNPISWIHTHTHTPLPLIFSAWKRHLEETIFFSESGTRDEAQLITTPYPKVHWYPWPQDPWLVLILWQKRQGVQAHWFFTATFLQSLWLLPWLSVSTRCSGWNGSCIPSPEDSC